MIILERIRGSKEETKKTKKVFGQSFSLEVEWKEP